MKNTSFKLSNFEAIKCDSPSHKSVCVYDQVKHDSSTSGAGGRWKPIPEYVNNSSGHDAGGRWKPLQECSQVCGMCVSRPSLSKSRCEDGFEYHRGRSLQDLTPKCLRHIEEPGIVNREQRIENRGERETLRPYDKMVKISGIDFGCDASRCYDKLMIIRGLMVCGEERGGRMVNMLSRGRFRRDLRRRLQKRGMCHLRSP